MRTLEAIQADLRVAEKNESEASRVHQAARMETSRLRLEECGVRYGLRLGSLVRKKRTDIVYRVVRIKTFEQSHPWVYGNLRKKDGTFSRVENSLYTDWEVVRDE